MAIVECGLCGWTEEIDEDLDPDVIFARSVDKYSRHMWEIHPHVASRDSIASMWVQAQASRVAKTNGALSK